MTDKIENLCLKIKNMEKLADFILVDDEKDTATTLINTAISSRSVNRILNDELIEINQLLNEHGFKVEREIFIYNDIENPNITLFVCKKTKTLAI